MRHTDGAWPKKARTQEYSDMTVGDLLPKLGTLQLLGIRGDGAYQSDPFDPQDMVGSGSLLIC